MRLLKNAESNNAASSKNGFFTSQHIYPKLTVTQPNDKYEQQGGGNSIQRMELDAGPWTQKDWSSSDRRSQNTKWHNANLYNLKKGLKDEYTQIAQRRDFYLWFYNLVRKKGFEVKWPLAAYIVAGGADKVASHDILVANESIEILMRQGNQIIFDDVFPKLKVLYEGPVLTGDKAAAWDMNTLAEEQTLIQPLYKGIAATTLSDMQQIAKGEWGAPAVKIGSAITNEGKIDGGSYHRGGEIPFFPDEFSLIKPEDRFKYGMMLAGIFAKDKSDSDHKGNLVEVALAGWHRQNRIANQAKQLTMPAVSETYQSGKALNAVKNKDSIHELTAISTNAGKNLERIATLVGQLNQVELDIFERDPLYKRAFLEQMNRTQFEIVTRNLDKQTTERLEPYMCPNCHDEQRRDARRKKTFDVNTNRYFEQRPLNRLEPISCPNCHYEEGRKNTERIVPGIDKNELIPSKWFSMEPVQEIEALSPEKVRALMLWLEAIQSGNKEE